MNRESVVRTVVPKICGEAVKRTLSNTVIICHKEILNTVEVCSPFTFINYRSGKIPQHCTQKLLWYIR